MRRHKMSGHSSRKSFRRSSGVHGLNGSAGSKYVMRGGIRL